MCIAITFASFVYCNVIKSEFLAMDKEHVLSLFKHTGALLDGHFQLTSGLHSAQYFQCAKVLQYPKHAESLCGEIVSHFKHMRIDAVIAPALGGIVVGQEVGRQLNARTMFTERKDGVMQLRRGFEITPNENVLVCEDVVTTGGSVVEVINIVKERGGNLVGVGYIVDRSGGKVKFGDSQFATLSLDVVAYKPEECPLCRQNIPVEKPGSRGTR